MTPITVKLANASKQDMDTALHIGGILNDLDDCNSAFRHCSIRTLESIDTPDAEEEPKNDLEDFDPENEKHCKLFVERLLKLLDRSPGCLNRVLWGFSTVRSNSVLDLESDHLALHPNLIAAQQKAEKYDADLAQVASGYIMANQIASDAVHLMHRALKQGMAHSRKLLEAELPKLAERGKACTLAHQGPVHINSNVRLFDLVRFMRSELLTAELITDDEYTWLCMEAPLATAPEGGSPSPRRLEDYDELRAKLAKYDALAPIIQETITHLRSSTTEGSDTWCLAEQLKALL